MLLQVFWDTAAEAAHGRKILLFSQLSVIMDAVCYNKEEKLMEKFFLRKKFSTVLSLILVLCMMLSGVTAAESREGEEDGEHLSGRTAMEITEMMGMGWNLGNTFDATGGNASNVYSQEQSWGNPKVTEELIDAIAKAGFNTIRIPVTWNNHASKDGDNIINEAFLNRVQEVVDYAYSRGMFVILNIHHEAWLNTTKLVQDKDAIAYRLSCIWKQLAERFAEYDQHLIFEGMNEPRLAGGPVEWGGNPEAYQVVNYLAQVFVSTVRSNTGGFNAERCLMVPGYAASNSPTIMDAISLPTWDGTVAKNLIISVHSYAPYDFCLSDKQTDWDPNNSSDTGAIDQMYENLKDLFLDQGIPVVLGETSATSKNNTEARERWAKYMGMRTAEYGVPMVIWDNGSNSNQGGESHAYIDRRTCEWNYPTVIQAAFAGMESVAWGCALSEGGNQPETPTGEGTVIWAEDGGVTINKAWDADSFALAAKGSYVVNGREIVVTYTGNGGIHMILDSEMKQAWWIDIKPDRVEDKDGKHVAYFTYDTMMAGMKANNVDSGSELRRMCFIAEQAGITIEKVVATGDFVSVIYKVNGQQYATGEKLPENPTVEGMTFDGWYTTKDYRPGTEFTGADNLTTDVVVYAKLSLDKLPQNPNQDQTMTPTPTPTKPQEENQPEENQPEVTPETKPETTPAVSAQKDNSSDNNQGLIIGIAVVSVAVIGGIAVLLVNSKKKNK